MTSLYVSRRETGTAAALLPLLASSFHLLTTTSRRAVVVAPPPAATALTTSTETSAFPGLRSRRGSETAVPSSGTGSVTLKNGTTVRKLATKSEGHGEEFEEDEEDEEEELDDELDETESATPSMSFSAVTRCKPERPIADKSLDLPEERG